MRTNNTRDNKVFDSNSIRKTHISISKKQILWVAVLFMFIAGANATTIGDDIRDAIWVNATWFKGTTIIANGSPWVDVKAFGATGTGAGDDWQAIQNAVNASSGKTVLFSRGTYNITKSIEANGHVSIYFVPGAILQTYENISMIRMNTTNTQSYYNSFINMKFNVINPYKTGTVGFEIYGVNPFSYNVIQNTQCLYTNKCIYINRSSSVHNTDWNSVLNTNTQSVNYSIFYSNGTGTGNVINGGNMVSTEEGIHFGGKDYGDILYSNIEFGGTSRTAIWGDGEVTGGYKDRISILNIQIDAGVVEGLNFTNNENGTIYANNIVMGGDVTNNIGVNTKIIGNLNGRYDTTGIIRSRGVIGGFGNSGAGAELLYNAGVASLVGFDRGNTVYLPLDMNGINVTILASGVPKLYVNSSGVYTNKTGRPFACWDGAAAIAC